MDEDNDNALIQSFIFTQEAYLSSYIYLTLTAQQSEKSMQEISQRQNNFLNDIQ